MTPTLLIIDDEAVLLHAFRRFFREPEVRLLTAASAAEGLRLADEQRPDAVVLDVNLPDMDGMEVFAHLRRLDARIPVIIMTGHGSARLAIEAMKQGAYDYVLKPRGLAEVRELVAGAFQVSRAMRVPALTPQEPAAESADVITGGSLQMQEVYKAIGRVAAQDVTVLVTGESGTGKELVARAIYQHSRRADRPFLAINCAAIPDALLESELFGHEKGAFTGAERQRIGKFEQCNGGTLFLDEVGDMPLVTQAKLLRVLQEQSFERVGGSETLRTNVRVIAATNRDLDRRAAEGHFRQDLYYRLNVFSISLPPLRERLEDLPALVEHFLKRFCRELGREAERAAPETLDLLQRHSWPGNVRELQSVLKQALLRAHGPLLLPDFLPLGLQLSAGGRPAPSASGFPGLDLFLHERLQAGSTRLHAEVLDLIDRHVLSQVLGYTGGNLKRSAHILGVTRVTLRNRLRALGLKTDHSAWSETDHPPAEGGMNETT